MSKSNCDNYIIKRKNDVVLIELGKRQMSQTFRAALSLYTFATRYELMTQEFRIIFYGLKCSIMLLNSGCYVQLVLCTMEKTSHLNPDRITNVFDTIMELHCTNMVSAAI